MFSFMMTLHLQMVKGRKMTAKDVVYSFSRIIDKQTASPGAWIFNGKVDTAEPFKAIDDTTFQLKLLRPYNPYPGNSFYAVLFSCGQGSSRKIW